MQLGITTFAETTPDPATGITVSSVQRLRDLLEEAELADQVGLDVYAVGEHHRPDFAASSPAVILAAIAARTRRIRLASAVTVLSSDDPVRVFQDFSTVDLLSGGRAEIMAGRGSFTESFPLFGQDLDDYDELFAEKLELLLRLRDATRVFWQGKHRPALTGQGVYPRPVQQPLPVWVAVGGSPNSMIRAGTLGLPVTLAIIGGLPERFVSLVELYRTASARAGQENLPLAINSHGFVGDDAAKVADEFYGPYAQTMSRIGEERGWPPTSRGQFDAALAPRGSLVLGTPQQVIDKILYQHELFGFSRYLLHMSVGTMPHKSVMRSIELFGTTVADAVRKATETTHA